ncbi:hypothetical protein ACXYUI_32505, partial [Klebsiella pneumoniae]
STLYAKLEEEENGGEEKESIQADSSTDQQALCPECKCELNRTIYNLIVEFGKYDTSSTVIYHEIITFYHSSPSSLQE